MGSDKLKFFIRNAGWSTLNPSRAYKARRAMKEYKLKNPCCEITGSDKKVEVHHIEPVWMSPEKADDPDNFICLSAAAHIHLIFGHDGSFKNKSVKNVKEISQKIRAIKKDMDIIHRYDIKTNKGSLLNRLKNFLKKVENKLK